MAERVGRDVLLTWSVAQDTTDGGKMQPPLSASLCREDLSQLHASCVEFARLGVQAGPVHASDTLPEALSTGPGRLLVYRVELFNARGHSAGPSEPVYAAAGDAPAPMGPIAIIPRRNAALITWTSRESRTEDEIRIERKLLTDAAGPLKEPPKKKKEVAAQPQKPGNTLTEAALTSGPLTGADPGGLVDRGIHDGDTVTYTAERVRTISLPVPASTATTKKGGTKPVPASTRVFEVHGEPSRPVTFSFHDTLPPSAPTGLAAIPGGGFGQPPSIDLSWVSNPESDVLSYNVYRAEAGATFIRLNAEPVAGPSYRDLMAQPGHTYRYRVTAVDQRHNESPQSAEVLEQLNP